MFEDEVEPASSESPAVPQGVSDVLSLGMQMKVEARYRNAGELAEAIKCVLRESEEEALRKAEEEVRRKTEEEAKRKAEEELKQRAEEEDRRKAEEELKQRAEEEAERRAEEEATRLAEQKKREKERSTLVIVALQIMVVFGLFIVVYVPKLLPILLYFVLPVSVVLMGKIRHKDDDDDAR